MGKINKEKYEQKWEKKGQRKRTEERGTERQSQTLSRFGFDPETDVLGFCCVFWYHIDSVTNETKNGS